MLTNLGWNVSSTNPPVPEASTFTVGFICIPAWRQKTYISRKLNCLEVCSGLEEENSHIPTLGHFSTRQSMASLWPESVRNRIQSLASKPLSSTQGVNVLSLSLPIPHDLEFRKSGLPAVCEASKHFTLKSDTPGFLLTCWLHQCASRRWGLRLPCCSTSELLYFAPGGPGLTACFKAEVPRWISRVHKH